MSSIRFSNLTFSGIYGIATRVSPDGTKTVVPIRLKGNDAVLTVKDAYDKAETDDDKKGLKKVLFKDSGSDNKFKPLEDKDTFYSNVKIKTVDANSTLTLDACDMFDVGAMRHNAHLRLNNAEAWASVKKIKGENVRLTVLKGARVFVKESCKFKLWTPKLASECTPFVDVSGERLKIKG